VTLSLLLMSCGSTSTGMKSSPTFDAWYEQVINEPYDPLNGSKY